MAIRQITDKMTIDDVNYWPLKTLFIDSHDTLPWFTQSKLVLYDFDDDPIIAIPTPIVPFKWLNNVYYPFKIIEPYPYTGDFLLLTTQNGDLKLTESYIISSSSAPMVFKLDSEITYLLNLVYKIHTRPKTPFDFSII
jgi:hypothetical protein